MFLKTHHKAFLCVFASLKHPPFIMLMLRRSFASVSHILLLTAVSRSTLSHLLFNLMAILDITAVASHLRRLLVFVPISGREFLWPWLRDFCPQKQHTVVVCSFSLQCTSWPPFKSLPVRQKQLVFSLFNNKFLTVEIVTLFGTKYQTKYQVTKLFLQMLCSFTH